MSDARPNGIVCSALRRIDKGNLIAIGTIQIPAWHLEIAECKWCRSKEGKEFIALPSSKFTNRAGETAYKTLVSFTDRAASDRFQAAALAAMQGFQA